MQKRLFPKSDIWWLGQGGSGFLKQSIWRLQSGWARRRWSGEGAVLLRGCWSAGAGGARPYEVTAGGLPPPPPTTRQVPTDGALRGRGVKMSPGLTLPG